MEVNEIDEPTLTRWIGIYVEWDEADSSAVAIRTKRELEHELFIAWPSIRLAILERDNLRERVATLERDLSALSSASPVEKEPKT